MREDDTRIMTRKMLAADVDHWETVIEAEMQIPRYDRAHVAMLQYRLRQLDLELLRRDLGGC